ncbi:MAG: tetratricopeptide repeat protein, partial [Rudaea sp.]
FRRALQISKRLHGADEQNTIGNEHMYGTVLSDLSRFDEAETHLQAAVDSSQRVFGAGSARSLRAEEMLGLNELQWGHIAEARDRYARMLALVEAQTPRHDAVLAEIRLNYAEIVARLGQLELAEGLLTKVRDYLTRQRGSEPAELAEALCALGDVHLRSGKLDAAESEERQSLALLQKSHIDDTSCQQQRLSGIARLRGDAPAAVAFARQATENAVRVYGARSHEAAQSHYVYGLALIDDHKQAQAETQLRAALKSYALLLPPDGMHPFSADARFALGNMLVARARDRDEGLQLLQQSLQLRSGLYGTESAPVRQVHDLIANVRHKQ